MLLKMGGPSFNKLNVTADRWTELRPFVTFRKVMKDEEIEILGQYIVLVEGQLETDEETFPPGYYDMTQKRVTIKGPGKVFYSNSSFEEEHTENRTIGELMIKSSRLRMSSQKRSTLVGGTGDMGGAFTRMLFTRDE